MLPEICILKVSSCPCPLGCIASKMDLAGDIPVSHGSQGEKKVFECKSSYFERHLFSILIPTGKDSNTALVSVLCNSL